MLCTMNKSNSETGLLFRSIFSWRLKWMAVIFFNFTKCRTRIVPRLFFLVLGSYDVKRSWNSTFDFYTFPPSVCSVQLQSYTFSAPSYFCSYIYVWDKIISKVEILYSKARDIHIECSKQFKWNLYFYVSRQTWPFWAALKLL